jgi:hypothetical protein
MPQTYIYVIENIDPDFYVDINTFINRPELFKDQLTIVKCMNLARLKNIYNEWFEKVNFNFITVSNINDLYKRLDINMLD